MNLVLFQVIFPVWYRTVNSGTVQFFVFILHSYLFLNLGSSRIEVSLGKLQYVFLLYFISPAHLVAIKGMNGQLSKQHNLAYMCMAAKAQPLQKMGQQECPGASYKFVTSTAMAPRGFHYILSFCRISDHYPSQEFAPNCLSIIWAQTQSQTYLVSKPLRTVYAYFALQIPLVSEITECKL